MLVDLHSHTTASDGELEPPVLLARAREHGVTCLAITDHDTIAAYDLLQAGASDGISLCRGIELSANWNGRSVHIVGLNIRPECQALRAGLAGQQQSRLRRAELIAGRLAKQGIAGTLEGARSIAGSDNIGRPHFAKFLVASGVVRDYKQAFRRFLGAGKAGDIQRIWPEIGTVISWIRESGGTAVLAHPGHYKLTNSKLRVLADEFIAAGGTAVEVISGRQTADLTRKLATLSVEKNLLASTGSDFHRPGNKWADLGRQSALPEHLTPVWDAW
jgi:predicted metal-dependent phosphoesterase TrpH